MTRGAKVLCLSLVAVVAMAGFAAMAQANRFMSEGDIQYKLTIAKEAGVELVLTVEGNKIECESFTGETGLMSSPNTSYEFQPNFSGCSAFGFLEATFTTTGCKWIHTPGLRSNSNIDTYTATMHISCPEGKAIKVTAGTCEAEMINNTTVTEGLEYINQTTASPKQDVTMKATDAPIHWQKTKDGFLCPFSGTGATTGKFNGGFTISGDDNANQAVGVTVEGTESH